MWGGLTRHIGKNYIWIVTEQLIGWGCPTACFSLVSFLLLCEWPRSLTSYMTEQPDGPKMSDKTLNILFVFTTDLCSDEPFNLIFKSCVKCVSLLWDIYWIKTFFWWTKYCSLWKLGCDGAKGTTLLGASAIKSRTTCVCYAIWYVFMYQYLFIYKKWKVIYFFETNVRKH